MTIDTQNATQHISTALASLGYLKSEHVRELSEIITNHVAEFFQGEAQQLIVQELAKLQSGIEHVARIDTSGTPDGYNSQDAEGRFSLNDLHKAAGGAKRHQPSDWQIGQQAQGLIAALEKETPGIPGIKSVAGFLVL